MKKFNTVLFIGTGGGNDVFSTTLAMAALWQHGWRWEQAAIAGVLSPFHHHTVLETSTDGVFITRKDSERFVKRKDGNRAISFIDAHVSDMLDTQALYQCKSVYGLSLRNGSVGLAHALKSLSRMFDYIVLVDVGGDSFYRGIHDPHILSPMFDAIVLRAFVDSGVPGILFEAGPGTDGEMEPEALIDVLTRYNAISLPIDPDTIDWWEQLYKTWVEPYRPGRTIPITIEAYRSKESMLVMPYRARAHISDARYYSYFDQRILTALCKNFYLVDPKVIKNPFAVNCTSPKEWFFKTQVKQHHTNSEANLEYLWDNRRLEQFLTPSPLLSAGDRNNLIILGVEELIDGVCDAAWITHMDLKQVPSHLRSKLFSMIYNNIALLERTKGQ